MRPPRSLFHMSSGIAPLASTLQKGGRGTTAPGTSETVDKWLQQLAATVSGLVVPPGGGCSIRDRL